MEAKTACIDADTLDMQGTWDLVQTLSIEVPPETPPTRPGTQVFPVKLATTGPGSHGGTMFEGAFDGPEPQVGTFSGETFYANRGVQVVQLVMEWLPDGYCYYQLFCGRHIRQSEVVEGAWVDVGGQGHGDPDVIAGYMGRFELRRTG